MRDPAVDRAQTIARLLSRASHLGLLPLLRNNRVVVRGPKEAMRGVVWAELVGRREEVLRHLRGSPGQGFENYPDRHRIHTYAFQQLLIDDQIKHGWVYEHRERILSCASGSRTPLVREVIVSRRWLPSDRERRDWPGIEVQLIPTPAEVAT